MQFINNIKGLYLVAALAVVIICIYLYTFLNRVKPPEEIKPKYPAEEAFVLKDLKYSKDTLNYLDLYLTKNRDAETPFLIIIHGGAWVQGDKKMFWTDMANDFYNENICGANINYRRLATIGNPAFPMQINDIESVIMKLENENYGISDQFVRFPAPSCGICRAINSRDASGKVFSIVRYHAPSE